MLTELFSAVFKTPAGSPIRELFPYLNKPGIISLAGGYPSTSLFDADGLRTAGNVVLTDSASILQYGPTEGQPRLKFALVALCAERGVIFEEGDLLVTTGSQQAFDLIVKVFVTPGDSVLVETPAYPAALQALRLAGANIIQVPVDDDGVDTEELEVILKTLPAGNRAKLLYTVPTFSNPSGTLLKAARREALVRLAIEYGFMVIEDDPYGELNFTEERTQPVFVYGAHLRGARNPVIYLSSLSKTVAPALRIGWMVAPAAVIRRCAIAKQTSDLCTSPLTQAIAAEYLLSGRYPATVNKMRTIYQQRMTVMSNQLQEKLGKSVRFSRPKGGMFLWLESTSQFDPKSLFDACVEAGVLYVPGAAFFDRNANLQSMRLSFAGPDVDQIVEAIQRLAAGFRTARA